MSTERTSSPVDTWLAAKLRRLTGWVLGQATAVIAAAIAVAVLSVVLAAIRLSVNVDRDAFLDPYGDAAHAWREQQREFGAAEDVIVAVESLDSLSAEAAAAEITTAIRREEGMFHHVLHTLDLSPLREKALYYATNQEIAAQHRQLARLAPLFRGDWSVISLPKLLTAGEGNHASPHDVGHQDEQGRLAASLRAACAGQDYVSPWLPLPSVIGDWWRLDAPLLLSEVGELASANGPQPGEDAAEGPVERTSADGIARSFVAIRLESGGGEGGGTSTTKQLVVLQTIVDQVASRHPQTRIGLTGLPALQHEERGVLPYQMITAGLLALLAAGIVLVPTLGGLRHAAIVTAAIGLALAATFGWVTLALGSVDALAASFAALVVALGGGSCVAVAVEYLRLRRDGAAPAEALQNAAARVGLGVLVAAGVAALALLALTLAESPGLPRAGLTLGAGVMLSAAAAFVVLPAMLFKLDQRGGSTPEPLRLDWMARLARHPRRAPTILAVSAVLTIAAATGIWQWRADDDFRATHDDNLGSVALEARLGAAGADPAAFLVCHADSREELLDKKARLISLPRVGRVEEMASLLPPDAEQRHALIQNIHDRMGMLPQHPPVIPVTQSDAQAACEFARQWFAAHGDRAADDAASRLPDALDQSQLAATLYDWQQQAAADLLARLHALKAAASPQPPTLADLPPELVQRFWGETGRQLLRVYPRPDAATGSELAAFIEEVAAYDPLATGLPMIERHAAQDLRRGATTTAAYACLVALVFLALVQGSLRDTLLALMAATLCLVQALGVLGWLGETLSPTHWIALPVLLAGACGSGALVACSLRRQSGLCESDNEGLDYTAAAIGMLMAIAACGSLTFIDHAGWQALGRVLVVGLACSGFSALFVLPAVATWVSASRPAESVRATLRLAALPIEPQDGEAAELPAAIPLRLDERHRRAA